MCCCHQHCYDRDDDKQTDEKRKERIVVVAIVDVIDSGVVVGLSTSTGVYYPKGNFNTRNRHQLPLGGYGGSKGDRPLFRPSRPVAKNVATQTFVNNFDTTFVSSKPNTVISLANEEDDPLIVVITEARILRTNKEDGSLVLEYDIEQLGSQSNVSSVEEFVGLDHQHCSIFVDDFAPAEEAESTVSCDDDDFLESFGDE